MDTTQYILGIMTCKNNLHKAEDQYNKYLKKISLYPIIYIKFIGDPKLQDEYVYDELNHLLHQLKRKMRQTYLFLYNLKHSFR